MIRESSRAALWVPTTLALLSVGFSLGAWLGYKRGKADAPKDFTMVVQMGNGGYCAAKAGPPCPIGGRLFVASMCISRTKDPEIIIEEKQGPFSEPKAF